ncbi:hypothetical protein ENSA5_05920 [Enhygromyxa salina]|uniref:Glycosyltransferase RgtA/B/C/D-like domain-containing protein n=1 Tax=Enhygromyxa salina TaxID=215803 RepID=A0A2S9YHU6_9BACT|nr:hypothetical protein [Enhygromyxa salina]PRQ04678.1 hypothetical protein ENSA5_05920 [Enhygromyxa salina]
MLLAPKTKGGEDKELLEDVLDTYLEALDVSWQDMLGYAFAAIGVMVLWSVVVGRRRATAPWAGERWLRLVVAFALIGVGLWRAFDNATCFDDAYISLRYAENFIDGKGLVYNEGEYVEGYTNFLWTMIVSLFMWLTPVEAPLIAVLGSMAAFGLNLWVVWRISLKIAPPFHPHAFAFPIAVALLAVQNTFTDYGTTGLETAFASLMVNLGILALISRDDAKATFWAGFCWIMATLTRPDHAVFYAVGSAVVFGVWLGPTWRARKSGIKAIWREGLRPMATYAAPFLIWLVYSAWKLRYYGELLPNTYYAKSAYMPYYEQGVVYAAAFHLASHLWIVVVILFLLWPWRAPSNIPGRRFMAFAVPALVLYEWYVIRVGGDFMYGRFYVTLIPLILLAGEQVVHEFSLRRADRKELLAQLRAARERARRKPEPAEAPEAEAEAEPAPAPTRKPLAIGAMIVAGFMAASAIGVRLIPPRKSYWYLTDESTYYPIASWSPIVIDHPNYRVGVILGKITDGLEGKEVTEPIIASGAIGLLGYYSRMPLIDRLGLTDATVAHREIEKRGRPGHEKWAKPEYLYERGVHFRRGGGYHKWFKTYATIRWGQNTGGRRWFILEYDRELMDAIREAYPDVWFYDFTIYIDKYIARLPHTDPKKARREFSFFQKFYFNHNDDPERREAFARYFQWVREGHEPRELLADQRWDEYKKRSSAASKRERELRRARAERRKLEQQWSLPWRQLTLRRKYGLEPAPKPKPKLESKSKPKPKPRRGTGKPSPRKQPTRTPPSVDETED